MATSYVITAQQLESLVDFPHLKKYDKKFKQWVLSVIDGSSEGDVTIHQVEDRYSLPSVGSLKAIYTTRSDHKIYIWNDTKLQYEVFGSDWEDIKLILGGDANKVD